ncbi:MAG: outer membrane beta-barrel family protein [Prevotellaceae bacterium]|nr:outer membrane beta-barrel family protein [Prevotellaceae bacterium]
MKRNLLFIFVLSLTPFIVNAQIKGVICDEEKNPIEFANIILMYPDSIYIDGTVADINGNFDFQNVSSKASFMRISALGYKTLIKTIEWNGYNDTIMLASDNIHLDEVVITGNLPAQHLVKGGIITTVDGTVLSQLGNAMDVIEQLPGIMREDDKFTVFGKGTPVIYVNGRRLTDNSELNRMSSKEIASVEVITNPGAKYGAEVKSVLLVRTIKKRGDGLSGSAQAVVRAAHSWSNSDNISLNFRKNNLDIFGTFAFDYSKRYQQQNNFTTINTENNMYTLNSDIVILPVNTTYNANIGFNWQINQKNVLGAKYEFRTNPYNRSKWTTDERIELNNTPYDNIDYYTHWKRRNLPTNILNLYYIGEYGDLTLTMNNDYYSSRNKAEQKINEVSLSEGESVISSLNSVTSSMFASKTVLEYTFGKNTVGGGYEYTYTDRTDRYDNHNDFLSDANDNIKEHNIAGFISATFPIGVYEISGGLRYEHTISDYYENDIFISGQSRKYSRLFPNMDFTFPIKRAKFTLSYTAKTRRPLYSQLSSNIQYDDRFTYETGNPLLKPEMNHDISLAGIYKWFFFSASYQYVKDAIVGIVDAYQEGKPINLMTYQNYGHVSKYSAILSFTPKISIWSPRLRLNIMGQDLKISSMGTEQRLNNPLIFINFYNSFCFGKGLTITGDVLYHTVGDMDVVTLKPSWQINLGISISSGNWFYQLNATDAFRTARNSMITYGRQMKLEKWNYSDSQAVRFTIRYAFNSTMNKYKGKSAGQSERNRL